ncbi:hypothetical protein [Bradyrhizobium canariense]|jgi:hypothetical protein|uniref:Uncharacterized protein n=1 Tax=Bradyrhizobium canariense TaxID=255045 RepID=A0A1H1ZQD3_9BRAD|nr:hypothetical protein [Bradyrhizobium canariense]SDT35632.1 hypothetical protein SAMN05444158_5584 [Bradyrhizobium canariense]
MTDISSITSSVSATISADLGKVANATKKSFADTLSKVQSTITGKPQTGFVAGPTYEANTLTGQTKAAFNNAVNATKSALHIKP